MRVGRWLIGCAALLVAGCTSPHDFQCHSDDACDLDGVQGKCPAPGYCSLPDAACASGQRYVDQAPADLGGQCVSSSWGLVAHWSLDEGEGIQVHDDSGNGYDGTLKDGPSWTKGLFGSALQFGMIGSRVEGMISGFGDASITGSAWTNSSTDTTTGEQHRVTGVGFPNGTYFFLTYNGGQPRLEAKSASDQYWDCGTMNLALADGKWHHLAFIIDRTRNESRFYVDGVMLGRCPRTSPADPFGTVGSETNTFIIGAQENTANLSYVGTVDEVKLWARALEDAEMRALARPPM